MKVALKAIDNKALDINLHLNDPKNTSIVYDTIRKTIASPEIPNGSGVLASPISDDSEVIRYNLSTPEEVDEIKRIMKNANRDDSFIALMRGDDVLATINDYAVVYKNGNYDRSQQDNVARVLRSANYILQIKREDVKRRMTENQLRREQKEGSIQIEKEMNESKLGRKYTEAWRKFQVALDDFELKNKLFTRKKVTEVKPGDIMLSGSGKKTYQISSVKNDNQNSYYKTIDLYAKTFDGEEKKIKSYSDWAEVYIKRDEEDDINGFFEIDWNRYVRTKQEFPTRLARQWGNVDLSELNSAYNYLLSGLTSKIEKDVPGQREYSRQARQFQEQAIKNKEYRVESHAKWRFSFRDRSGYLVDLSKYFGKMAEIKKGMPQSVKNALEELKNLVTEYMNEASEKIKTASQEERWNDIERPLSSIKQYNTQWYDRHVQFYNDETRYNADSENYISEGKALSSIARLKESLERAYSE